MKVKIVRNFHVKIIPNEISIENFRDIMEYFGSVCYIIKTPYVSDGKSLGWTAYVEYESWKPTEQTKYIDELLQNKKRKNILCFMEASNVHRFQKPILHSLVRHDDLHNLSIDRELWILCKNSPIDKEMFHNIHILGMFGEPENSEFWVRQNQHLYFT